MADTHKPRHIRDIAHLYISRLQSKSHALSSTLLIAGGEKRCLPGFHAANIATAVASKGVSVHLYELSGLLPNAGFFMSLPPGRYTRSGDDEGSLLSGLGGVKVSFSFLRSALAGASLRPRLEIIHLPPLHPERAFQACIWEIREFLKPITLFLHLMIDEDVGKGGLIAVEEQIRPVATCALRLRGELESRYRRDRGVSDLGGLLEWESALTDRVPVVIRAPDSALARAYQSICDTLLCKITQFRSKLSASHVSQVSAGIRSG